MYWYTFLLGFFIGRIVTFKVPAITPWTRSLSVEFIFWNWRDREVSSKSNVFISRVGKCASIIHYVNQIFSLGLRQLCAWFFASVWPINILILWSWNILGHVFTFMLIHCLEFIKLEYSLRLKIKRNDWLLADACPKVANHCPLFWVWEWKVL